ncbi:DUF1269 domain-containing protein [Janibacter sp. GS2]|uniref:DUF1269 domain-containing protein n=1 Tax=Janibacter sp. GS2 TaxID=3442646 RepID=UPI003EBE3022
MATLTVWKFESADGADQAESTLLDLQQRELVHVHDAATVSWEPDSKKPKTRQLNSATAGGMLGGSFWGLLFGLIFFVPLLGAAIGAASGALAAAMTDVGIDDEFINRVRGEVTPGTSALFLMSSDAVIDRVAEEFRGHSGRLVETNLTKDQEATLRAAFE